MPRKKTTQTKGKAQTKTTVNWKTKVSPNSKNKDLMISKIMYGSRKMNEQANKIRAVGDLERNEVNKRLTKFGAMKHNKKSIAGFYDFTTTNDMGDVTIRYSKRELEKLSAGQLRKILKGLEDLHEDKVVSVKGMKKYFKNVRNKIWTTLKARYQPKYSKELWAIIEDRSDVVVQRVLDACAEGKVGKSDEILEEYVSEILQDKEVQGILQDTIERAQAMQRDVVDRRAQVNADRPILNKRMYRNQNRR